MRITSVNIVFAGLLAGSSLFLSCGRTATSSEKTNFTHVDSLTEKYLSFQDTLLQAWNVLARDEKEKLESIEKALHGMIRLSVNELPQLSVLHNRLDQLKQIHLTQKTLSNPYVIEEYDFASSSLVSEVLALMESNPKVVSDAELAELIEKIKFTDQQIEVYRNGYDSITSEFNSFIEINKISLKEVADNNLEKRPVFNSGK